MLQNANLFLYQQKLIYPATDCCIETWGVTNIMKCVQTVQYLINMFSLIGFWTPDCWQASWCGGTFPQILIKEENVQKSLKNKVSIHSWEQKVVFADEI